MPKIYHSREHFIDNLHTDHEKFTTYDDNADEDDDDDKDDNDDKEEEEENEEEYDYNVNQDDTEPPISTTVANDTAESIVNNTSTIQTIPTKAISSQSETGGEEEEESQHRYRQYLYNTINKNKYSGGHGANKNFRKSFNYEQYDDEMNNKKVRIDDKGSKIICNKYINIY